MNILKTRFTAESDRFSLCTLDSFSLSLVLFIFPIFHMKPNPITDSAGRRKIIQPQIISVKIFGSKPMGTFELQC